MSTSQKGAPMPERDGYLPGVPSWVDTSQPDPDAAVAFYSGLFGWDFEDVMPPGSPGAYFIGRLRGGDVAAVGSQPEGGPPMAVWNTYIWVESADEPGSLNFNSLNTRDPEGAKSFYGSVFGWETLGLDGGAQMWRLPGYGEFLERSDPGLRERMADSGAPAGFEDVVAALNPIADDQPDVPAHWGVTFAVDDADATAA